MTTINRSLLRLSAVCALNSFGVGPAFPTLAGVNVYDSRIQPSDTLEGIDPIPICVVYTDYDKDFPRLQANSSIKRNLTLTIEILMVRADTTTPVEDDQLEYLLESPETDADLEMSLDVFEAQVFQALFHANNPASDCFRYLCPSFENVISRRGATVEGGTRLTARQITIEAHVPRDPQPGSMPAVTAAFLDRLDLLDEEDAYRKKGQIIRALLDVGDGLSQADRENSVMALNTQLIALLGRPSGPVAVLGTPVVYLQPNGTPL